MGLDMYLTKEYYIKNWDFMKPEEKHAITITKGGQPSTIEVDKIHSVIVDVAYWRKANSIHKWFVDNVQDGVDECQHSTVTREQLEELLGLCKQVLADHKKAPELLPAQSGFFFGSTDYDKYYFEDIEDTISQLEAELYKPSNGYFPEYSYHSSW